jgi:hypothetical protein
MDPYQSRGAARMGVTQSLGAEFRQAIRQFHEPVCQAEHEPSYQRGVLFQQSEEHRTGMITHEVSIRVFVELAQQRTVA